MDRQAYIDEIKFRLTGGILECELDDVAFNKVLDASLREMQRYIDTTVLVTVPYKTCIDMNEINDGKINSVSAVYRTRGYVSSADTQENQVAGMIDPMYANQWQLLSGGASNMSAYNSYIMNYAAYNTLLQNRNTVSTDMFFKYDKSANKLYINSASGLPDKITIEYVPRYDDVSEIKSDFWIDILMRLATAMAKVTLGRIRTRYTQSGTLWAQDGETMLAEGKEELQSLRESLQANTQLIYGID